MAKKIKEALSTNLDSVEFEKKLLNFVTAAYDVGVVADYVGIWIGKTDDKIKDLWEFYCQEINYIFSKRNNK